MAFKPVKQSLKLEQLLPAQLTHPTDDFFPVHAFPLSALGPWRLFTCDTL
jgi:hypothetical protein